MDTIYARNVNEAYATGVMLLRGVGERQPSRAGDVLVAPYPVVTVYERPTERVLFDEARDANPFFHLFESIWMLAGRDDARYLDQFVRDFGSRFAEPDGHLWGAYGGRWRNHWDQDQLASIAHRLRRDPNDRRVVLTMWDPQYDLWGPDDVAEDGEVSWPGDPEPRDLPCNTHVYPRVRRVHTIRGGEQTYDDVLDLTVCCRSNDVVWGAYGANAVHFSVLQEYLAASIGCQVGRLYQLSNNWHGYVGVLDKVGVPSGEDLYQRPGPGLRAAPEPMVTVPSEFLRDCERFCDRGYAWDAVYANNWFHLTAEPMLEAHRLFREGDHNMALRHLDSVKATDWRLAAQRWISRRTK